MNIDRLAKISSNIELKHWEEVPAQSPLSEAQRGIYFECIDKPDSDFYNIVYRLDFPKSTDVSRLAQAVKNTVASYPVFDVCIDVIDGTPMMVRRHPEFTPEMVDVPVVETDDIEAESKAFQTLFDLKHGPLYGAKILVTAQTVIFFWKVHHLIFDGNSLKIFSQHIVNDYMGAESPEEVLNQFDIGMFNATAEPSEEKLDEVRAYYEKSLGGFDLDTRPIPDVVVDCPNEIGEFELRSEGFFTSDELRTIKAERGITENTIFHGAFAYANAVMAGTNGSFYLSAGHGRYDPGMQHSIGMYVQTLPMYFEIDHERQIDAFLDDVRTRFHDAKENDVLTIGELISKYDFDLNTVFVYMADFFVPLPFGDDQVSMTRFLNQDENYDLNFEMRKNPDGYQLNVFYRKSLYSESFVRNYARLYFNVIAGMIRGGKLCDIELIDDTSRRVITKINETEAPYRDQETVVSLFRAQVLRTPDNTCLVCGENRYTYSEVDDITDRLAAYLIGQGVGREKVVGVLIHRSEYMLLCALGVLKSGGAYLPLDPTYPPERLNLMVQDSGAMLLISEPDLVDLIDGAFAGERMLISEIKDLPEKEPSLVLPSPNPEDLFVMIYTSGSTGVPKGVMFQHSNSLVTVEWEVKFYGIDEQARVTSYASYGFDANVYDMYPPIISGGELHIITEEMRLDFPALREYFNTNGITHTVMTTQVGRQFALLGGLTTLRHLSVAGEKLTPLDPPKGLHFYNLYGPTEGSIITSYFEMDQYYNDIPIGQAVENLKVYIVDKIGRLLPCGATGELLIAGPHVTRGYLNRPEKTAEVYKANAYDEIPLYERTYSTGDIVRLNEDGNMQFIGRRDAQVKIRGFRVELTEVEEIVRRFPGVKDATVAAFDDQGGGKYLAAYVVSDETIDIQEMNEFIRSEKPPYMVPAVTMQIDKIPLNQNHKVNKKALPVPVRQKVEIVAPQNEMQTKLHQILSEIIGHEDFGITTDLFDAGLNSIGNVRLIVALDETFHVPVKITDIKANPTIKMIEAFTLSFGGEGVEAPTTRKESYPITDTQAGIFTECMASPNDVTYNIPLLLKFAEDLEMTRLIDAIREAFAAHDYLLAQFGMDSQGDICAKPVSEEVKIDTITCSTLPKTEELVRPFTLLHAPLYRIEVYETVEGKYLFMDIHHLICDGTSEAILLRDISRAYAGEKLERERFSGYEKGEEERANKQSANYETDKLYWKNLLNGCETECLPKKEPEADAAASAAKVKKSGETDLDALDRFCKEHGFTLNGFFNAVTGFVVGKYLNMDSVTHATIYNGRSDSRLMNACTMAVRTIPVVSDIQDDATVVDFVAHIQKQVLESMSHETCAFPELASTYKVKADIMLVYQGDNFEFDSFCGKPADIAPVELAVGKEPISISISIKDDHFEYELEYCTAYYSQGFAQSLLASFVQAAHEFVKTEKLRDISLMTDYAEALYSKLNEEEGTLNDLPIPAMIDEWANSCPDQKAVVADGKSITFSELVTMSNAWAAYLRQHGIGEEKIVGLVLDRTVEAIVAEIAVMKAGGAFLPMLPTYPDDRIEYCLTDSESLIVITTAALQAERTELFGADKPYRTVTIEELYDADASAEYTAKALAPESLAYCIYTSGSTGTPKGVMIEHRNFSNVISAMTPAIQFLSDPTQKGSFLAMSSLSFDMSISEIYLALCNGKTSCIATEEEIHNPLQLRDLLRENDTRMMICTPSFAMSLISMEETKEIFRRLVTIIVGAEAFTPQLYGLMRELNPQMQIMNGYGPTEATQCCSLKELNGIDPITIGRPIGTMKMYVADKFLHVLPAYASGELIICGVQVGRGYVKLPEKTAASFVQMRGLPAYRSGDAVRLTHAGEIDFCGRIDNQVKLRGFRIELDEVENAILSCDGVLQCKVIVRNNGTEDYLAGFYTAETEITPDEIKELIKSKLTYYMIPAALVKLDAMPMTNNGKIDKKALPETNNVSTGSRERRADRGARRAAKKSMEQRLCELFANVLGMDEVYPDENFFELGGTSLTASKVTMLLMADNIDIQYGDIFDNPTPEELAAFIEKRDADSAPKAEVPASDEAMTRPALQYNLPKYAPEVKLESLGNVLLTGATGFLGIHVLKELLELEKGHIYCLVRHGEFENSVERLKTMLIYYFSEGFEKELSERITVLDGDITDAALDDMLAPYPIDTLINCAACVKHFTDDDILERINVKGVEHLIEICLKRSIKLIQISTTSVPGMHTDETYARSLKMHENELFVIDDMDNKYAKSKYQAELRIFDAIEQKNLRAKVIRVGNLMGRNSDGEFQANMETNMFIRGLRGFYIMGKYPISHMTDPMRFSPIDCTARAVVLLSATNDKFTAFHADNRYGFDEMKIIDACNRCGITILPEEDEKYYEEFRQKLADDHVNAGLNGLAAYDLVGVHVVETDNLFTTNILYRIGFSWPLVDDAYLERAISSLETLGYFEWGDENA